MVNVRDIYTSPVPRGIMKTALLHCLQEAIVKLRELEQLFAEAEKKCRESKRECGAERVIYETSALYK